MKKQVRKIVLSKETLRHLDRETLAEAVGGVLTKNDASICVPSCIHCPISDNC
jgi:hypothetical protein